jgi:hypothetical protein
VDFNVIGEITDVETFATGRATKASAASRALIDESLLKARRFYAPRSKAVWSDLFYQYANRLAHHYFLRHVNGVHNLHRL